MPPYSADEYAADLAKVTEGRNDPELTEVLVDEASTGCAGSTSLGLKYRLMYERQAYERADGTYLFWGGLHVGNMGGGEGLMADHTAWPRAGHRGPLRPGVIADPRRRQRHRRHGPRPRTAAFMNSAPNP